jgi:hypothetical protein
VRGPIILTLPFILWLLIGVITNGGPGGYTFLGERVPEPFGTLILIYSFIGYFIGGPLFLAGILWILTRLMRRTIKKKI